MNKETKFYGQYALMWLIANPMIAIGLIIIAIFAGGLALNDFIMQFMNPIVWILSIVGSMLIMLTRNPKYTLMIAAILGIIWFGINHTTCDIPILCWIWEAAMLIPNLVHIAIIIGTILLQMTILGIISVAIRR